MLNKKSFHSSALKPKNDSLFHSKQLKTLQWPRRPYAIWYSYYFSDHIYHPVHASRTGHLAVPQIHQAYPHLRAFALAVPFAWNSLLLYFPHLQILVKFLLLMRCVLTIQIQIAAQLILILQNPFHFSTSLFFQNT